MYYNFHKIPPYYGYDPSGENTANPIAGGSASPFNFVKQNPISILAPCFVAYRGSGIWTFAPQSNNNTVFNDMRVVRVPNTNRQNGAGLQTLTAYTSGAITASDFLNASNTGGGAALTTANVSGGISVLCPNYTTYRFQSTNPGNSTLPYSSGTSTFFDGSSRDVFRFEAPAMDYAGAYSQAICISKFWGAGTDFGLYFFLNVPTLRVYANTPTGIATGQ